MPKRCKYTRLEEHTPRESNLYRRFLAEREQVLRLKSELEEEQGHHVRFETALTIWIKRHRMKWLKEFDSKGLS